MAWPTFRDWVYSTLAASTGWRVPGQGAGCIMIRLKPPRAMASSSYAAGRVLRKRIKPKVLQACMDGVLIISTITRSSPANHSYDSV